MLLLHLLACAGGAREAEPTHVDTAVDTVDTDTDTGGTADTDTAAPEDTAAPDGDVVIAVDLPSWRSSLAWLPDEQRDGRDEVAIGRSGLTTHQCLGAAADGPPPPSSCPGCLSEDDVRILRGRPGAAFSLEADADRVLAGSGCVGAAVAVADLDGDGVLEIVGGAPMSERGGDVYPGYLANAGEVAVYPGVGPTDAPTPEPPLGGWVGDLEHGIGDTLLVAGDLDGDGRAELVTSMSYAEARWSVLPGDTWSAAWGLMFDHPVTGVGPSDGLAAGDLDGDGLSDLVVTTVVGTDLAVYLWPGTTGFMDIDLGDATPIAAAPGLLTDPNSSALATSVADGDGDGYGDAWVRIREPNLVGIEVFGVGGDAAARAEVLGADGLVRFSRDGGSAVFDVPVALGAGEASRLALPYLRQDTTEILAEGILTYTASQLSRGAVLVPEDGIRLWTGSASGLSTGGDWDGSGVGDLAFAVAGAVVETPEDHGYAETQYAVVLLDP